MRYAFLLLAITSFSTLAAHDASLDLTPAETAEIYSAAIRATFDRDLDGKGPIQHYVVQDLTRNDTFESEPIGPDRYRKLFPAMGDDLLEDFFAKNTVRKSLSSIAPLLPSITLCKTPPPGEPYLERGFYQRYPHSGGIVSVSAIGVNRNGSRALVNVGHAWSADGGNGYAIVLKKLKGHWKVIEKGQLWFWVG